MTKLKPSYIELERRVQLLQKELHQFKCSILEESRRKTRFLDDLLEGCQIIGFNWRYIYINNSASRQNKCPEEELLGRKYMDAWPGIEKTEVFRKINDCLENRKRHQMENEFEYPDGSLGWFDLSIQPIPEGAFILSIDITERKLNEQKIQKMNQELELRVQERTSQLERANKELQTFTYSVSHDLKAPLRGIDGYSKLLQELYKDKLDEEARGFIQNIREGSVQMNQLIEDLLAYSRLERSALKMIRIHLQDFIGKISSFYQNEIEKQNIALETHFPSSFIIADQNSLTIAVRNLIENSIKFSRPVPKPKIVIGLDEKQDSWTIYVHDNGIGFNMEYREKIFDIFQRLHRVEEYPGTGIGLALVAKAIQRLGGKAWAKSQLNEGSTFYLEIPKN